MRVERCIIIDREGSSSRALSAQDDKSEYAEIPAPENETLSRP